MALTTHDDFVIPTALRVLDNLAIMEQHRGCLTLQESRTKVQALQILEGLFSEFNIHVMAYKDDGQWKLGNDPEAFQEKVE